MLLLGVLLFVASFVWTFVMVTKMKRQPNNYFHVRVYTDDGSKIELWRDRKNPSTRREIIDGLKRAIEIVEKVEQAAAITAAAKNVT